MSFLSNVVNRTVGNVVGHAVGGAVGGLAQAAGGAMQNVANPLTNTLDAVLRGAVLGTKGLSLGALTGGIDAARIGIGATLESVMGALKQSPLGPALSFPGFDAQGNPASVSLTGQPADGVDFNANPLLRQAEPSVRALAAVLGGGDPQVTEQLTATFLNALSGARTPEQMSQGLKSLMDATGVSPRELLSGLVSLKQSGRISDQQFQEMLSAMLQTLAMNQQLAQNVAPNAGAAAAPGGAAGGAAPGGAAKAGGSASSKGPSIKVDGPGGFLWKPVSDSDGKLVVLAPPNISQSVRAAVVKGPDGQVIEEGRLTTRDGNGGRAHFRFQKTGASYPEGSTVEFRMNDGTVKTYTIKDTSMRND